MCFDDGRHDAKPPGTWREKTTQPRPDRPPLLLAVVSSHLPADGGGARSAHGALCARTPRRITSHTWRTFGARFPSSARLDACRDYAPFPSFCVFFFCPLPFPSDRPFQVFVDRLDARSSRHEMHALSTPLSCLARPPGGESGYYHCEELLTARPSLFAVAGYSMRPIRFSKLCEQLANSEPCSKPPARMKYSTVCLICGVSCALFSVFVGSALFVARLIHTSLHSFLFFFCNNSS